MALPDCAAATKVALFLNHRCNLRCRYCYNGPQFDRPMPRETAYRAVDFAFAQAGDGLLVLSFFGGEPMLEVERLEQVVAYARDAARRGGRERLLRFALSTNATVLDDRRLALLTDGRFRVQVSIDGGERAQDATRRFASGRSSWRRASTNLARLIAAGVEVHVVAIVDPANVRYLVESFEALRELGARHVYFAPNLAADWDEPAERLLDQHVGALADRWADAVRAGADLRLDPFHGKVISHLVEGARPPTRCAFGDRELAVSPRGRIYPCDRIVKADADDTLCLGDLTSGLDETKRRAIVTARDVLAPECAACDLAARCTRSCGCSNYEQTGHPGQVSPALCLWERTVIAHTDRVANELAAERNPWFVRRFYGVLAIGKRGTRG